jgi:rhodanese-related sulfurtransferase
MPSLPLPFPGGSPTLGRVLPAATLLAACACRPAPEWNEVLTDLRARFPQVAQVSVEELLAAESDPGPLLLDARSGREFATSHLRGARHAPDEAAALAALAGVDPEREIVVYCSVGLRSSALAARLGARGFAHVANLEGGIFAWANAGQPTYRGEERVDGVDPFDERWGALLAPERRARGHGRSRASTR